MTSSVWFRSSDETLAERSDGCNLMKGLNRWMLTTPTQIKELYTHVSDSLDNAIIAADQSEPPTGWVLLPDGWFCIIERAYGYRVRCISTASFNLVNTEGKTLANCTSAEHARVMLEEALSTEKAA